MLGKVIALAAMLNVTGGQVQRFRQMQRPGAVALQ
jgi:hypothetical protein